MRPEPQLQGMATPQHSSAARPGANCAERPVPTVQGLQERGKRP